MNPLPEDPADWPHDPYVLLGVARGAAPTDIRKAYTRLIRQYKPEQFPEQFRRIREAFESIQRFGAFSWPPHINLPPELQSLQPPPPFANQDAPPTDHAPVPSPQAPSEPTSDLDRYWEQACAGEETPAYAGLKQLSERPDCQQEAYVRLYWLLRAAPELEPDRSPCHWLARSLREGGWHGPCQELYRREVELRPAEAWEERFAQLLKTDAPLNILSQWLHWRWRAVGSRGRWELIVDDLQAMRARFQANLEDETWAYLLLAAIDHLAWILDSRAEEVASACYDELESMVHLHQRIDMHQLDVVLELSNAWKNARDLQGKPCFLAWLRLVPESWTAHPGELRLPLLHILKDALADPEEALAWFDKLRTAAPFVLTQLANLMERVTWEPPVVEMDHGDPSDLDSAAAAFLREKVYSNLVPPRLEFFRFCLREFILPHQALAVLTRLPGCPPLIHECADDAVRLLCTAYRWFWA